MSSTIPTRHLVLAIHAVGHGPAPQTIALARQGHGGSETRLPRDSKEGHVSPDVEMLRRRLEAIEKMLKLDVDVSSAGKSVEDRPGTVCTSASSIQLLLIWSKVCAAYCESKTYLSFAFASIRIRRSLLPFERASDRYTNGLVFHSYLTVADTTIFPIEYVQLRLHPLAMHSHSSLLRLSQKQGLTHRSAVDLVPAQEGKTLAPAL